MPPIVCAWPRGVKTIYCRIPAMLQVPARWRLRGLPGPALLSDGRHPARVRHDRLALRRQRVLGVIGGYQDWNDHNGMRHDPALKQAADRLPEGTPSPRNRP